MRVTNRFFVELLAPPFLAALWLTIFSLPGSGTLSDFLHAIPVVIMFSYVFAIIPAGVYAFAMELWFHGGLRSRFGLICTAGWSGFLGGLAGYFSADIASSFEFLDSLDCFHFLKIGALIGLLIGFYFGRKQQPNTALEPAATAP
jgi:hypothetical protein